MARSRGAPGFRRGSRRDNYRRRRAVEESAETSPAGGIALVVGAFLLIVGGFVWKSASSDPEVSDAGVAEEWDDYDEPLAPAPIVAARTDDADEYWKEKRLEHEAKQGAHRDATTGTASTALDDNQNASVHAQNAERFTKKNRKKATAPVVNKLFGMDLSANLGGQPMEHDDRYTWARIGYFLQSHDFYLVFPNGKIPILKKRGAKGKAVAEKRRKKPPGDPRHPMYRLVVRGQSYKRGGIKFYGRKVGDSFACELLVRLERLVDGQYKELRRFTVGERHTPVSPEEMSTTEHVRKVYDMAVDKLLEKLGTMPMFKRRKGAAL